MGQIGTDLTLMVKLSQLKLQELILSTLFTIISARKILPRLQGKFLEISIFFKKLLLGEVRWWFLIALIRFLFFLPPPPPSMKLQFQFRQKNNEPFLLNVQA